MSPAVAQEADDWVGTWTASPQPVWAPDFLAPAKVPRNLWNQTVREKHIKAEFDSGDHLHPNDAGYVAMANSIDLGSLLGNKK